MKLSDIRVRIVVGQDGGTARELLMCSLRDLREMSRSNRDVFCQVVRGSAVEITMRFPPPEMVRRVGTVRGQAEELLRAMGWEWTNQAPGNYHQWRKIVVGPDPHGGVWYAPDLEGALRWEAQIQTKARASRAAL